MPGLEKEMKNILKYLLVVLLCFVFFNMTKPAWAYEADEKHAIDIELEKRIEADSSTFGIMGAYTQATFEWGKLLNQNYQALMQKLNEEDQARLRETQRAWIKYRDLEFAFSNQYWGGFQGTMYRVVAGVYQANVVRDRALRLESYLKYSAVP